MKLELLVGSEGARNITGQNLIEGFWYLKSANSGGNEDKRSSVNVGMSQGIESQGQLIDPFLGCLH